MLVYATFSQKVDINPVEVLKQINFIPAGNWIKVEEIDGVTKYFEYEEVGAGSHSFDQKVGEVTKEVYDLQMAKHMIIKELENRQEKERREKALRDYEYYSKHLKDHVKNKK